jgi:hypothetical protein
VLKSWLHIGVLGAVWGTFGVAALLVAAIYRLTPIARAAYEGTLSRGQWWIAGLFCVAMIYFEGYRGFQLRFSPRTAARIRYLRDRPNSLRSLLAPMFAMGFFHAAKRTRITAYALTTGIVVLVLLVHRLDQPWRGIVDSGVVLGLTWGLLSLLWWIVLALTATDFDVSPEVSVTRSAP